MDARTVDWPTLERLDGTKQYRFESIDIDGRHSCFLKYKRNNHSIRIQYTKSSNTYTMKTDGASDGLILRPIQKSEDSSWDDFSRGKGYDKLRTPQGVAKRIGKAYVTSTPSGHDDLYDAFRLANERTLTTLGVSKLKLGKKLNLKMLRSTQ